MGLVDWIRRRPGTRGKYSIEGTKNKLVTAFSSIWITSSVDDAAVYPAA